MKKIIVISFSALLVLGLGIYFFLNQRSTSSSSQIVSDINFTCIEEIKQFSRDIQMDGLIPNGGMYDLLKNYYACNPMKRGEIVAVQLEGVEHPIPRIVRAVPGDRVEVMPFPQENAFTLRIQGEILFDSTGKRPQRFAVGKWKAPYKDETVHSVFKESGFVLGPDEFLVFSYVSPASSDSSEWGPIKSSQIVGRGLISNSR